jgi:signal transduction histidine kinase
MPTKDLPAVELTGPKHLAVASKPVPPVAHLLLIEAALGLPLLAVVAIGLWLLFRRQARQRQESERQLREFLATAGHELRNALTTVSCYAQLARLEHPQPDDSPQPGHPHPGHPRDDALARVSEETERMASLIDELVLLTRLDLRQPLEHRSVDLPQLCRDAVAVVRDLHPGHPVRLIVAPGKHTVTGDPLWLRQVVVNLLTNSRLHTPEGTTTTLGLGTEEGGYRVIEVIDDGPGVPPELFPRIFDRFVRGEGATAAGSGLGLSIVAAVAAAHGGTVTLERFGQGAWFRVRLPG